MGGDGGGKGYCGDALNVESAPNGWRKATLLDVSTLAIFAVIQMQNM